ncbi:MAG: GGDEF domain-containing protein [Pseudomonadota bacterium]
MFRIKTNEDIVVYTIIITLLATLASAFVVYHATKQVYQSLPEFRVSMTLAVGIPLLVAGPISALALTIIKRVNSAVDKLEYFVKFDPLTGVLTRNYFLESVRRRFSRGGALFLVDADYFKNINDTFGHDVGDEALQIIGRTLNLSTNKYDLAGRVGGEEFALFFPNMPAAEVAHKAEQIKQAICDNGKTIGKHKIDLTVSIGIAQISKGSTLTILFKEADENLYVAKRSGRNRCVWSREEGDLDQLKLGPSVTH